MAGFEVIPAIDLLEGRCVRLSQGRYDDATVYGEDPGAVAAEFARQAIPRLHVVDLDGAKAGRPLNAEAVRAIVAAVGDVPVQRGGVASARWLRWTMPSPPESIASSSAPWPCAIRSWCARPPGAIPGRIVVGIDAKDGRVAVEGWLETSETRAVELAPRFEEAGVAAIVYTDIASRWHVDGTRTSKPPPSWPTRSRSP